MSPLVRARIARALIPFAACAPFATRSVAQGCVDGSVGLTPLTDLMDGTYLGVPGGLYPGGVNMRPPAHDAAGLVAASAVVPLDAAGSPDSEEGRVGFVTLGYSITASAHEAFLAQAASDPDVDPRVVFADGTLGGQVLELAVDPDAPYWAHVEQRVGDAGLTNEQVQVAWIQQSTVTFGPFPAHAHVYQALLGAFVQIAHDRFPNLRIAYLSGNAYGGYVSVVPAEPTGFEGGFAIRGLIEEQIAGAPGLNPDPGRGPVEAPWLAWGPYFWADGDRPRADGLRWTCADFLEDGLHPSAQGAAKLGAQLREFLRTDATARPWYLTSASVPCGEQAEVERYGTAFGGPGGIATLVASRLPTLPTAAPFGLVVQDAPAGAVVALLVGAIPLADGAYPFAGGSVLVDPAGALVLWTQADSDGRFVLDLGWLPDEPLLCGLELRAQAVVADLDSPGGADLTRGLRCRLGH